MTTTIEDDGLLTRTAQTPLRLCIEREDHDDGSITYHLWDGNGNWIIGLNDAEDRQGNLARNYANQIVTAVNAHAALLQGDAS